MQAGPSNSMGWRGKTAIAVLILWIVGTVFFDTRWLRPVKIIQNVPAGQDERSIYFKRFDSQTEGWKWPAQLGYVDDSPTPDWLEDHLYSARFAVAPALVEKGADYEYVLGNFHPPAWMTHAMLLQRVKQSFPQLVIERDFNNGVILFRNPNASRKQPERP